MWSWGGVGYSSGLGLAACRQGSLDRAKALWAYPSDRLAVYRPGGRTAGRIRGSTSTKVAMGGGHELVLYVVRHVSSRQYEVSLSSIFLPMTKVERSIIPTVYRTMGKSSTTFDEGWQEKIGVIPRSSLTASIWRPAFRMAKRLLQLPYTSTNFLDIKPRSGGDVSKVLLKYVELYRWYLCQRSAGIVSVGERRFACRQIRSNLPGSSI